MKNKNFEKIDKLMSLIYEKIKKKEVSDEEFATSEEIKNIAFEILEILKGENIETTYENLTNMNFHILVKILNFNNFFKDLKKEKSEYLKTLKL